MSILPYLLQEGVTVENLGFEIIKSNEDLGHGTFDGDHVSFIRHTNIEEAQLNKSLLRMLRRGEFVCPRKVINESNNIWLVVEKIDFTLDQFIRNDTGICSSFQSDTERKSKSKIIIRYEDYL